jgi:hypothetical protein
MTAFCEKTMQTPANFNISQNPRLFLQGKRLSRSRQSPNFRNIIDNRSNALTFGSSLPFSPQGVLDIIIGVGIIDVTLKYIEKVLKTREIKEYGRMLLKNHPDKIFANLKNGVIGVLNDVDGFRNYLNNGKTADPKNKKRLLKTFEFIENSFIRGFQKIFSEKIERPKNSEEIEINPENIKSFAEKFHSLQSLTENFFLFGYEDAEKMQIQKSIGKPFGKLVKKLENAIINLNT